MMGSKYPGDNFLNEVLNNAPRHLGYEKIDNLYRASFLGGNVGARVMLANDERCLEKWGEGDATKAGRLLEVWASTAVIRLLQYQKDQGAVLNGTARGFSSLFHSDEEELRAELLSYQEAMKAETLSNNKPRSDWIKDNNNPITRTLKDIADSQGIRHFSNEILYLRTLKALGDEGVPSFKLLPIPWGILREMSEVNPNLFDILDVNILLPLEPWLLVPDALISTLKTAQEYLKRLEG